MADNTYCGVKSVPRGKVRGTPEICVRSNQIRYYGLHKIDKELLKTAKGTTTDLIKEQLKLKKYQDQAKLLIKDVKNLMVIINDEEEAPKKIKSAEKKMKQLLVKRDTLSKNLKRQQTIVEQAEKEDKQNKRTRRILKEIKEEKRNR